MANIVTIDPTVPAGNEPLKLGPTRFRDINTNLLVIFGFQGNAVKAFGAPFSFDQTGTDQQDGFVSVLGDPRTALGIATKQYADSKLTISTDVVDIAAGAYVGSATPIFPDPPLGDRLFLVQLVPTASTNAGQVNLQLNSLTPRPVVRRDGSQLTGGEWVAGAWYLLAFDPTPGVLSFRILDFIGGQLDQPLLLATAQNPLLTGSATDRKDLAAATKQYVDQQTILRVQGTRQLLITDMTNLVGGSAHIILTSPAFTPPDDGRLYRVFTSYNVCIQFTNAFKLAQAWCDDGAGNVWAGSSGGSAGLGGSGWSPNKFGAPTPVTINLRIQTDDTVSALALYPGFPLHTYLDVAFVLAEP